LIQCQYVWQDLAAKKLNILFFIILLIDRLKKVSFLMILKHAAVIPVLKNAVLEKAAFYQLD